MAVEQGFVRALNGLGKIYESKGLRYKAFEYYSKAADKNDPEGQCNLGRCYEFGVGVNIDYLKSVDLYSKAIENGFSHAMFSLGQSYEYGRGVQADWETAYNWYKKGADAKNPDADCCYKIAEVYYRQIESSHHGIIGYGLDVSDKEKYEEFIKTDTGKDMLKYYHTAASLGHYQATKKLKKLGV